MNRDFHNTLGLCRRAGFINWGHDAAMEAIKKNKAKLCIVASDASERLKNEFIRAAEYDGRQIEIILSEDTMKDIMDAIGVKAAVITVNDEGFTKLLKKHMN